MTAAAITERRAQDVDGYEFVAEGEIVGLLVWITSPSETHDVAGWWLVEVAGKPDEALYRVPKSLAVDLDAARRDGESSSLWFARAIIGDVRSGLLGKVPAANLG